MRQRSLFAVFGLLLVLLVITNLKFPFAERVKQTLSDGFNPFLVFASRLENSASFLMGRTKKYSDLQLENTELARKVTEMEARAAQVGELERQNHDFRAMLDFKDRTELKLVSAKIIGRDPSNWWNTMMVDRGKVDGITRDMPVLTVDGLVGKTIEVGANDSRVLLLVDENCKVSGLLQESTQYGIVQGNILVAGSESSCRMMFVDRFAQVKVGEKVVTSGLGGIFPRGLLIGTVSSVHTGAGDSRNTLYQQFNVRPAVDLARIDEVFIGIGVKPVPRVKAGPGAASTNSPPRAGGK